MTVAVSPVECSHVGSQLVRSFWGRGGQNPEGTIPDRAQVTVCPRCGRFVILADKNGQVMELSFELATDELVTSAGQYVRYLRQEELPAKLRYRFPDLEAFLTLLAPLREKAGLSQAQLAAKVGISRTHLSSLETGKAENPSYALISRLASAVGLSDPPGTTREWYTVKGDE